MGEGKYAATASKFYGVPINMMDNSNKVRLIWYEKDSYNNTKWSIMHLAWQFYYCNGSLLQWDILAHIRYFKGKIWLQDKVHY